MSYILNNDVSTVQKEDNASQSLFESQEGLSCKMAVVVKDCDEVETKDLSNSLTLLENSSSKQHSQAKIDISDPIVKSLNSSSTKLKFTRRRYLFMAYLSGGYLLVGVILSSIGVAIPTLADNLRLSIDGISPVVVARGSGYLIGSIFAGILERYINGYYVVLLSQLSMFVGMIFIPTVLNVYAFFAFNILCAMGMSGFEIIGNVAALQIWGVKSEPIIQFLHFWFCVGSAVSSFIWNPFINEAHSITRCENCTGTLNESAYPKIKMVESSSIPFISIPYFLTAAFILFLLIFVTVFIPRTFLNKSSTKQENIEKSGDNRFRLVILILLFIFYFFYIGMEVTFFTFLFTFGISDAPGMSLSKEVSVYLNSTFFFSIVIGQFFAIFMSKFLNPTVIILIDLAGVFLCSIVLVLLPVYGHSIPALFWAAVGLIGLFAASIYGTTFLWADHFIKVNACAASSFIVGGSLGEMLLPLPVGLMIESNPMSFLYIFTAYVVITTIVFLIAWRYASAKGERIRGDHIPTGDVFDEQPQMLD